MKSILPPALFLLLCASAPAASIIVPNGSFEQLQSSPYSAPPSWSGPTAYGASYVRFESQVFTVRPATGADGANDLYTFVQTSRAGLFTASISNQVCLAQANTQYTLTFVAWNRGGDITAALGDSSATSSASQVPIPMNAGWVQETLTFSTPPTVPNGDEIVISTGGDGFAMWSGSVPNLFLINDSFAGEFDNFQLEAEPAPEPSSILLIGLAVTAAALRRRRA